MENGLAPEYPSEQPQRNSVDPLELQRGALPKRHRLFSPQFLCCRRRDVWRVVKDDELSRGAGVLVEQPSETSKLVEARLPDRRPEEIPHRYFVAVADVAGAQHRIGLLNDRLGLSPAEVRIHAASAVLLAPPAVGGGHVEG